MTYRSTDTCGPNKFENLRAFAGQSGKVPVLFGAGISGEYISHYLTYSGLPAAFFVDNSSNRIGKEISGIPVLSPSALESGKHGVIITSERYADEILAQLQAAGHIRDDIHVLRQSEIQTTFDNDPAWPDYAITHYSIPFFKKYLDGKQIDHSADILAKGPYRFINPFSASPGYRKGFFAAYLDYVLPNLFDDFSMVVEGPGEYGAVQIRPGDNVIDCGANVGLFSAIAAAHGGEVHAFEPLPECFALLEDTARLFNGNIRAWPLALSDAPGSIRMSFPEDGANTGGSFVLNAGSLSVEVEATTIDRFVETNGLKRVDFIKADIEGAERFMLQGATKTLRDHAPKLSICTYHLPDDPAVLESIIRAANPNYVIEHRWQKLYAHVPDR